jgi:hypothetical protein
MRCVAIIEANAPSLDSIILWADANRVIAVAYLDGRVSMTRPLATGSLDDALKEARESFRVEMGQLARITDWEPIGGAASRRWGL